jgi:glycosyltransferase involved in cell wall biosynthesis
MRIMEIVSGSGVNGAVSHCALLTRELARRGHAVTLLCRPGAWIAKELADAPVDVLFSELQRFPPRELRRVAAEIRRRQIEVLHTHMSRAHFFGVLLRYFAGVPSVATAHSQRFQPHWMCNDLVIAVSEATRRFQRRYNLVRSSRIVTIHNFVPPTAAAAELETGRRAMRASLGVPADALLLGIVGTILPGKGHLYLIRALPKILSAAENVRLAVVGTLESPGCGEALRREAKRLGVEAHIAWVGHRSDVSDVMSALDVCVVASLQENLPQVVLEAMASGVPVVATAVGGIPECVLPGETGLLVPPRDSSALADAVVKLLRDPPLRRALGAAGRRRVQTHFSPDSQVPLIEAALARVVRSAR